jgi:hypothetical protein
MEETQYVSQTKFGDLIKLLETEEYQNNKISTAWLDKLISEKVQAEKPPTMLGVICGVLHIGSSCNQLVPLFQKYFRLGSSAFTL